MNCRVHGINQNTQSEVVKKISRTSLKKSDIFLHNIMVYIEKASYQFGGNKICSYFTGFVKDCFYAFEKYTNFFSYGSKKIS